MEEIWTLQPNGSQRAVSLYGVYTVHISEDVINAPITLPDDHVRHTRPHVYKCCTTPTTQARLFIKIFLANNPLITSFFFSLVIFIVQNFKAHSQTDVSFAL